MRKIYVKQYCKNIDFCKISFFSWKELVGGVVKEHTSYWISLFHAPRRVALTDGNPQLHQDSWHLLYRMAQHCVAEWETDQIRLTNHTSSGNENTSAKLHFKIQEVCVYTMGYYSSITFIIARKIARQNEPNINELKREWKNVCYVLLKLMV